MAFYREEHRGRKSDGKGTPDPVPASDAPLIIRVAPQRLGQVAHDPLPSSATATKIDRDLDVELLVVERSHRILFGVGDGDETAARRDNPS